MWSVNKVKSQFKRNEYLRRHKFLSLFRNWNQSGYIFATSANICTGKFLWSVFLSSEGESGKENDKLEQRQMDIKRIESFIRVFLKVLDVRICIFVVVRLLLIITITWVIIVAFFLFFLWVYIKFQKEKNFTVTSTLNYLGMKFYYVTPKNFHNIVSFAFHLP